MFGRNADPETFPPDKLKSGQKYTEPNKDTTETFGYVVYQNGIEQGAGSTPD